MPESAPAPPASPWTYHHGPTFEINLGFGRMFQPSEYEGFHPSFGGPDVSLGGWLSRRLALTWRLAGTARSDYLRGTTVNVVVGPSLQVWFTESLWAGATVGRSLLRKEMSDESHDGWGFELRAGATLNQGSKSTFNLSLDLTPSFYPGDGYYIIDKARYTGLALLAGYQYL